MHHLPRILQRGVLTLLAAAVVAAPTLVTGNTPTHASTDDASAAAPAVADLGSPSNAGVTPVADASSAAPEVVGGTPAVAVSYVGDMQMNLNCDPNFHWCGVSLISPNSVETNAHCASNEPGTSAAKAAAVYSSDPGSPRTRSWTPPGSTSVTRRSGTWGSDPPTVLPGGGGPPRHRDRCAPGLGLGNLDSQGRVDDIALMKLDKPVLTLQPALIREASSRTSVRVVGWGYTTQPTDPTRSAPVQMQQIDVLLEDPSHCGGGDFISHGEICLGLGVHGGGPCNGDSGTGALQHVGHAWILVGSASRLPYLSCGVVGQDFAVYTDAHAFLGWIIRVVLGLLDGASVTGRHLPTLADTKTATSATSKKHVALAG